MSRLERNYLIKYPVSNITKGALYSLCQSFIQDRLDRIESRINSLQQALASETKSSAGDKHETGRAMIQLEREKLGNQLAEAQLLQERFKKVPVHQGSGTVMLGSVVYTSDHQYYMAISAGKLTVDGKSFYAIAPDTPIGKLLMGKTVGETIIFNGNEFCIRKVG